MCVRIEGQSETWSMYTQQPHAARTPIRQLAKKLGILKKKKKVIIREVVFKTLAANGGTSREVPLSFFFPLSLSFTNHRWRPPFVYNHQERKQSFIILHSFFDSFTSVRRKQSGPRFCHVQTGINEDNSRWKNRGL